MMAALEKYMDNIPIRRKFMQLYIVCVLVPLIIAILVLGFFPGPVLDVVNPSVAATMTEVGLTDPVGGTP